MYINIEKLELLRFNNCKDCDECCRNKYFAPLVLEDFEKVYNYFPILIAKLDYFKPVMLLSNNDSCPYLIDGSCSIYDNRPPACIIYPYTPFYNEILLDVSCKGVGIEGDLLPLTKDKFYKSKFFHSRISDISKKLQETSEYLENKEIEFMFNIKGIDLYKLKNIDDKFANMHFESLRFLDNYQNII